MIDVIGNELIVKALAFASEKHRYQVRKGKERTPYIHHPIQVANILVSTGKVNDTATICAALLHDTIEDTKTNKTELADLFGKEINNLVIELTDDKTKSKQDCRNDQICNAKFLSTKAKLIRLSDKICNVHDIGHYPPLHWDGKRRMLYLNWAAKVVDELRGINGALELKFDLIYNNTLEIINATNATS